MKKLVTLIAVVAAFVVPAAASATTTPIQSLAGDFHATNSTVTKTPDGVHFGTYADGGAIGGSLVYTGFNGHRLDLLTDFSYTFTYRQAGNTTGAAPYARVFLDADTNVDSDGDGNPSDDVDDDVILDPSFCATTMPVQAADLTYQMVGNQVRYDDDGCDGIPPDDQSWADVVAAHADERVSGIVVSQGFSTGTDVSSLLRQITVNGDTFLFNVPPADGGQGPQGDQGPAGPQGPQGGVGSQGPAGATGPLGPIGLTGATGAIGATGAQGPVGATGAAGKDGTNGSNGSSSGGECKGDTVRTLHAATIKGATFMSATASLRGKSLKVQGRTITVNLTGRPEANYNVRITARYRFHGHSLTVRTTRSLSVACS